VLQVERHAHEVGQGICAAFHIELDLPV